MKVTEEMLYILDQSLTQEDKQPITLKVTNNGTGIHPDNQRIIFEKFTQVSHQLNTNLYI